MNTTHQRNVANNMIDLIDTIINSPPIVNGAINPINISSTSPKKTTILPPIKVSLNPAGSLSSNRARNEKSIQPVKSSYVSDSPSDSSSLEHENNVRLTPSAIRDRLREIEQNVREVEQNRDRNRRLEKNSGPVLIRSDRDSESSKEGILRRRQQQHHSSTPSSQIIESYGDSGKKSSGKLTPVVENSSVKDIVVPSDSDSDSSYSESIIQPLANLVRTKENNNDEEVLTEPLLKQIRRNDDSDSDETSSREDSSDSDEEVTSSEIRIVRLSQRDLSRTSSRFQYHDPLSPTESSITLSPEIHFSHKPDDAPIEKKTAETHVIQKSPSSKEKSESGTKTETKIKSDTEHHSTTSSKSSVSSNRSIVTKSSSEPHAKIGSVVHSEEETEIVQIQHPPLKSVPEPPLSDNVYTEPKVLQETVIKNNDKPSPELDDKSYDKYQVIIDIVEYTIITIDFFNKIIYYLVRFVERNIIGTESAYTIYSRLKPIYDVLTELVIYKISSKTAKIISKNKGKYGL